MMNFSSILTLSLTKNYVDSRSGLVQEQYAGPGKGKDYLLMLHVKDKVLEKINWENNISGDKASRTAVKEKVPGSNRFICIARCQRNHDVIDDLGPAKMSSQARNSKLMIIICGLSHR